MLRFSLNLKILKPVLKALNQRNYSDISKKVLEAKADLEKIQGISCNSPYDLELCNKEKEALCKFVELRAAEESTKKQSLELNGWLWVVKILSFSTR